MLASVNNQIEVAKVLMEARADPFLRDNNVRSISSFSITFHVGRVTQRKIRQENGVILILKDGWTIMKEILKD